MAFPILVLESLGAGFILFNFQDLLHAPEHRLDTERKGNECCWTVDVFGLSSDYPPQSPTDDYLVLEFLFSVPLSID